MATKPKATPKGGKGFEAMLKRKLGPLPVWAWALVGVGAVYVYRKATASRVPTADVGAGAQDTYGSYASGYQDTGYGGGGGGSQLTGSSDGQAAAIDTSGIPESIPLSYEGGPIPVKVTIKRPRRRHNRQPPKHRPRRNRPRTR